MLKRKFLFVFLIVLLASTFPYPIKAQEKTYLKIFEKDGTVLRIPTISLSDSIVSYQDTRDFYQFNVTLSKTPVSSIFNFPLETEGLEFYYQPPLNEELDLKQYAFVNATHALNEKGEVVVYRPRNVVGSYAVYREDRKTGNKYTTGKLYHIYRPLLVDAKGETSWTNLSMTKTSLTIICDQKFLAEATYPLVVDPTFGYTNIGASGSNFQGYIQGSIFTSSEAGTVTQISVAVKISSGTADRATKCAIYLHSNLSLTGASNEVTVTYTTTGTFWNFSCDIAVSNAEYLLVGWTGSGAAVQMCYDSGDVNQGHYKLETYNGFPNPLVAPTHENVKYSIYAAYTTGGEEPVYVSCTLTETVATTATLSASKLLYRSGSVTTTVAIEGGQIKSIFMSSTLTAQSISDLTVQKLLHFTQSATSSITTIIETQKDINVHMIVEITGEILVSAILEATKHIGATLIDLLGTAAISSTLQAILPIIPLTAEEAAFIGILFAVVVLVVCVALIYRRRKT